MKILLVSLLFANVLGVISIPNCVDLSSNVKIDQTEVTVSSYFFYWSDNKRSEDLEPNAEVFQKAYQVAFDKINPESVVFNSPMVGLSKVQCLEYCKWRTEKVNQTLKNGKVSFRLPTFQELQEAGKLQAAINDKITDSGQPFAYNKVKSKKLYGIHSNVSEYTSEERTFAGTVPFTGFRCVADLVK